MKTIHGGDIYRNHVTLDYSVNMNPLGIPNSVKDALHRAVDHCGTYPDIHVEKLKNAVSEMIDVSGENLVFGNGASELFIAAVHALQPKKVVIPVPSFYGYEQAAGAVTDDILYYYLKEEKQFLPDEDFNQYLHEEVDMLFIANPNNPTGVRMEKDKLVELIRHCKIKNITVVLDECFIEFCCEERSQATALNSNNLSALDQIGEFDNLIIIRAFTKIFTIPGVRLGYLVCGNEGIRAKIARQLPEWNISTFAQEAGIACTKETEFLEQTYSYLETERNFLFRTLENIPELQCKVYSGSANFLLLHSSKPLYEKLLDHGILIRDCSNFRGLDKGYYRIAVKTRQDNEQLVKVLGEINWNE